MMTKKTGADSIGGGAAKSGCLSATRNKTKIQGKYGFPYILWNTAQALLSYGDPEAVHGVSLRTRSSKP